MKTSYLGAAIAGTVVVAAALGVVRLTGCEPKPTAVEYRADSVLASAPAWQDTVKARDAQLARYDRVVRILADTAAKQRARADSAEAKADSLKAWADGLAEVDTSLSLPEQNTQLLVALAAQKQAAAQFQSTVIALKAQRTTDSLRLADADSTITLLSRWRGEDRDRIDGLTKTLSDLRQATKRKGELWVLGLHFPNWLDDAALGAGAAYVGYRVGRAAS